MFNRQHFMGSVGRIVQGGVLASPIQELDEALENFTQKGEMPKRNRNTPPSSGRKRARTKLPKSVAARRSAARKLLFKVSPTPSAQGNGIAGAMKKKGGKVAKEGRKKKVRVSRAFRKKVNEAIKSRNGSGWLKEVIPNDILKPVDNQQAVRQVAGRITDDTNAYFFNPTYVDYVASLLYNKKGPVNPGVTVNIGDTDLFRRENLKIEVLDQYYIVKLRNNTARVMDICLYDVSPKYTQEGGSGGTATFSPEQHWEQAFAAGSRFGAPGTVGQQSNENPTNVFKNAIGAHPMDSQYFRGQYTCDTTYVKLEPGKEYYHKVKGPNRKLYDYNSFFKNGVYRNIRPFCKATLVSMSLDLNVTTVQSKAQRATDIVSNSPYGLIMEVNIFTKVRLPDKAGFQNPAVGAVGGIQELTQVGNAFAINNWYEEQSGIVEMIQDENPQNVTVVAQ